MINRLSFFFPALLLGMCTAFFAYAEEGVKVKVICQEKIPFTIKRPGKYVLSENIKFRGSGSAIIIKADNVQLNLGSFSIFLSNPDATGILVDNASEFVISNDSITNKSSNAQNGFGISVVGAQKGLIDNVFTNNHLNGLKIQDSLDIQIKNSEFSNATVGALVVNSTNIAFNKCVFNACGNGLMFSGTNQDCSVVNSDFPSATFANLLVQQMNGFLVENCSFTEVGTTPNGKSALVQFGDADPAQLCNDVVMRSCTVVNKSANTSPEGIGIYQGAGFLVESCVIDTTNIGQDPEADLSGIHISNPGLGANGTLASNVIIRNCVVQGPATDGFYPDVGSSNVLIENCLATGAQKDGIFLAGTTASLVKNNLVTNNGTNGIFLGEESISNAVLNNTVINNGASSIASSIPPIECGIGIAADSSNNTIQHNDVLDNTSFGINDLGSGNTVYFNTAFSNPVNYSANITDVSLPGGPAKSAENITNFI